VQRPTQMAIAGVLLAACAGDRRPPAPPPFFGPPPGPPAELGPNERTSIAAPSATAPPLAAPDTPDTPDLSSLAGSSDPAPRVAITIEPPFRLDRRVVPADKAAFLADLRDRTRWNQGGLGTLAGPLPKVAGHPVPKVIVDVTHVAGPHPAADVQRILRKMFWSKVVECYGLGAYKDQKLRGKTTLKLRIARAGKVTASRVEGSNLNDPDVVACLADKIRAVDLPKARAGSQVTVEIQVGPGDEPMPPPPSLAIPGDGILPPEVLRGAIAAALPSFEACYRQALEYAPELWGRLGIRFHLTDRGKLDEAFEVESRFPDERVTLCVLRAARALSFPKPKGGEMRFIVPLRFQSERSPVAAEAPADASPTGSSRAAPR
jgi:hypothetical protein